MDKMTCWSCQAELHPTLELEDGDHIECDNCGKICIVVGTRTMSEDEAYEGACDSEESKRYEEAAYGRYDDEDDVEPDTHIFQELD